VDADYFRAFGVPVLAGRTFQASDFDTAATAIVVNRAFVQKAFGGGSALGRRVRQPSTRMVVAGREPEATPPGPWLEIVGVVSDFPNPVNPRFPEARVYRPLVPGVDPAVTLAVRTRGGAAPAELGARLRTLALAVDPMLRIQDVTPLDESLEDRKLELRVAVLVVELVTLAVLLLSAAGIYALISFTITKRRQEIGIRAALGATPRQVIGPVLARAMRQIAVGIVIGLSLAALADSKMNGGFTGGRGVYFLVAIAAFMAAVGGLAAVGPARRALRIPPTEALKAE
jgi:putative ABC transport system permease protein